MLRPFQQWRRGCPLLAAIESSVQQLLASIAQQSLLVHSILAAGRQVGANERTTVDLKDLERDLRWVGTDEKEETALAAVMARRVFRGPCAEPCPWHLGK
jgi:hypothetical protein